MLYERPYITFRVILFLVRTFCGLMLVSAGDAQRRDDRKFTDWTMLSGCADPYVLQFCLCLALSRTLSP
jgi:hypothetical protein